VQKKIKQNGPAQELPSRLFSALYLHGRSWGDSLRGTSWNLQGEAVTSGLRKLAAIRPAFLKKFSTVLHRVWKKARIIQGRGRRKG